MTSTQLPAVVRRVARCAQILFCLFFLRFTLHADDVKNDHANTPAAPAKTTLSPLPPPAHVEQSVQLDGKALHYTVTIGSLPVQDKDAHPAGDVVYTAYTIPGKDRPVTFALNGGPGAASVYLNLGAIGPKHVPFGSQGNSPSDPATLVDNPGTWLDFTDLVFIDPIGTGFSRSLVPEDQAKKLFYSTTPDIQYLSRIIYTWLVKNERLASRKYLVGESYGGFRGPRITHYLQTQLGVAMNGVVLVSPYLNPSIDDNRDLSPIPWMMTLPSITAAYLERHDRLTQQQMESVINYTRGEYATDLLKGHSDPEATPRIVKRVTEMTGLDPAFVKQSGGRLETQAFLREEFREEGRLGSRYDPNVTAWDPFPYDPQQRTNDPLLESIIAPTTTAMVDFVTRVVGWKVDARYNALSEEVARLWDGGEDLQKGAAGQLRESVATDPKLRVLIVHGWDDLSCPFMGSILTVDQMPIMGDQSRVQVKEYPGGHMFYTRPASQSMLRKDVVEMYSRH
ncbi:MAG TPA: peptidase S10 [Bryobacteraceae bacterium]|jgi:carboxypeptidase C (cathepsin A)|nr:peptidase S10 [Bryobacteraceae bacterium]